jgi:hypothetical protein
MRAPTIAALALLPLSALGSPVLAAWSTSPLTNLPVCTAAGDQESPTIVSDGAGGAIITWYDFRSGNADIYAQHVLPSGTVDPSWPTDGRALCTVAGNQDFPTIVSDGSGGAIVTWSDARSGSSDDIYAQHVLISGTVDPAWPTDGRALCTAAGNQDFPTIVSDGSGGAIVTWDDLRGGSSSGIYAQHVLASGAVDPRWPTDGQALCTAAGTQFFPTILSDGAGGAIVTWQDWRSVDPGIYAQHVLASGTVDATWPANGRALCTTPMDRFSPAIASDGAGGAIITWWQSSAGHYAVSYAQHVQTSGAIDPAWPSDGRALNSAVSDQIGQRIVSDGAGGAFVTWYEDWRNGVYVYGVYAQHVLASGMVDPAWPAEGRALSTAAGGSSPAIVSDQAGGVVVTWFDYRGGDADIYAQHVPASGAVDPVWPADGRALCSAAGDQLDPTIISDGAGGAIVTWYDTRSGTGADIYAQRVQANGELGGDSPTATQVSLVSADTHEGTVRLCWYVSLDRPTALTVYRSDGSGAWRALNTVAPDAAGYVRYEDGVVVAGARYGYRLGVRGTDGSETFAGEAWVVVPLASADLSVRVPNPIVGGEVTVSFVPPLGRTVGVELFDLAGRVVASRQVSGGGGRQSIGLARSNDLAPGVYLVRVGLDRPVTARVALIR